MAGGLPLLSLLDRLIDEAPEQAQDPPADEATLIERTKAGLRRDLEGLLNGKRPYCGWLSSDLSGSVIGFGVPDLSTEDFAVPAVRDRVRRIIAATIRTFETRLSDVQVEGDGAPGAGGIAFRISAVLTVADAEEAVGFDARVRASDRVISVDLSR